MTADATDESPDLLDDRSAQIPPLAADPPQETVVHERIKGVITRRLEKVRSATRAELKQALESKDRPAFDMVFDALVVQRCLVVDENATGKATRWRLASL